MSLSDRRDATDLADVARHGRVPVAHQRLAFGGRQCRQELARRSSRGWQPSSKHLSLRAPHRQVRWTCSVAGIRTPGATLIRRVGMFMARECTTSETLVRNKEVR